MHEGQPQYLPCKHFALSSLFMHAETFIWRSLLLSATKQAGFCGSVFVLCDYLWTAGMQLHSAISYMLLLKQVTGEN